MFKRPPLIYLLLGSSLIASIILSLIAYPEIYLTFKTSFMLFDDYLLEYFNTSIIAGFMAQGNIQLWDHFGQMPFAYLFTTLGTFKFPNVIAACVFYVLSPLSEHTGALFHHVFAWVNLMALLFLRVTGIFLMIKLLINDTRIVAAVSVIAAVFYCQPGFLIGTFYQSFYPIIFYMILGFLERFQARYLAAAFCFFVISFSNSLIHACYMYMGVHFFILCALGWSLFCRRTQWLVFLHGMKTNWRTYLRWSALIVCFSVIVLGPYVWMQKIGVSDVEFNVADSRLGKMFSVDYYFHSAHFDQAAPSEFFRRMLDFTVDAGESFFCGLMVFVLAAAGAVFGRDSRKWIFVLSIVLVYLVNFPREGINPGTLVHWLNALTNPFKSILRSYHMASHSVFFYLLIALAAIGIEEILLMVQGRVNVSKRKVCIVFGSVVFFVLTSWAHVPEVIKIYLSSVLILLAVAVLKTMASRKRLWIWFMGVTIVLLLAVDVALICHQTRTMLKKYFERRPYETESLASQGPLGIDLADPLVFPFREYGASYFSRADAFIGPLVGQPQNYFKFTSFMLNFIAIDGHNPRHKSYASWVNDPQMWRYIQKNDRMIFHAAYAVQSREGILGRIVDAGLEHDVIMVDDPSGKLVLPQEIPIFDEPLPKPSKKVVTRSGFLSEGRMIANDGPSGIVLVSLMPPKDFPDHLATTFFTEDRSFLRFLVQKTDGSWQECSAVQGEFLQGCSFDVQNYKKDSLTVAVDKNEFSGRMNYIFMYAMPDGEGLTRVWHKEFDHLGLDYQAKRDGWLVFQYPFDRKWQITVDGTKISFYRVNKSFIGFPLSTGVHAVEMRYEPGSLLRPWLLVSVVCSTLGLIVLLAMALRWENAYNRKTAQGLDNSQGAI